VDSRNPKVTKSNKIPSSPLAFTFPYVPGHYALRRQHRLPTSLREKCESEKRGQVVDSKNGRRGSNPRRPAWENVRRLFIKDSHGEDLRSLPLIKVRRASEKSYRPGRHALDFSFSSGIWSSDHSTPCKAQRGICPTRPQDGS
jgi:hypothetical protein